MPTIHPDESTAITGLVAMLRTTTQLPVGDGQAPGPDRPVPTDTGDPVEDFAPYLVVTHTAGGNTTGDAGSGMASIVETTVQITGVGISRNQASMALARAHHAIVVKGPDGWINPISTHPGRVIARARTASGGVLREGPLFNAVGIYTLTIAT